MKKSRKGRKGVSKEGPQDVIASINLRLLSDVNFLIMIIMAGIF